MFKKFKETQLIVDPTEDSISCNVFIHKSKVFIFTTQWMIFTTCTKKQNSQQRN